MFLQATLIKPNGPLNRKGHERDLLEEKGVQRKWERVEGNVMGEYDQNILSTWLKLSKKSTFNKYFKEITILSSKDTTNPGNKYTYKFSAQKKKLRKKKQNGHFIHNYNIQEKVAVWH